MRAVAAAWFRRFGGLSGLVALATVLVPPFVVLWPWLTNTSTFGFHDWDVQTSHRYLVKESLLQYGQFPGWNPYACGGFPAWGYVEADTVVVSPLLPLYLFADIRLALRIEVLAMALVGSFGTYLLAGRFTKAYAARAFVVALFAVNGRFGLQAAAGHTWHLAYALMPWCWFFFERARDASRRVRDIALLGASFAALVYAGGIYPLPHTVLLLALWAAALALLERRIRPLTTLALGGLAGLGLSASKLLPLLATFGRAPRTIESTEKLDLGSFVTLLTSRKQAFYDRPANVSPYGWHEWGMYIGVAGALALLLGLVFSPGRKEACLKAVGLLFVALGFGAFHPYAPWSLLHAHAPVFGSEHVPSRFLYPATLVLGIVAASGAGKWIEARTSLRPWLDPLAGALVFVMALDVASIAELPMKDAMWMEPPDHLPENRPFSMVENPVYQYKRRDWAGPMYLAMLANTGVVHCYGTPPFEGVGAIAATDPRYRGEAFVEGMGVARVSRWTPNEFDIEVDAPEGGVLVYNMNYDAGFTARVRSDGGVESSPAGRDQDRLAAVVPSGHSVVTFSYTPVRMKLGIVLSTLTLAIFVGAYVWERSSFGRRRGAPATRTRG